MDDLTSGLKKKNDVRDRTFNLKGRREVKREHERSNDFKEERARWIKFRPLAREESRERICKTEHSILKSIKEICVSIIIELSSF